jgi:hypothetical protein
MHHLKGGGGGCAQRRDPHDGHPGGLGRVLFFGEYIVNCSKEGHQKSTSELSAHLNGWYAGNIVFGGLIGLLIVDPGTGAMWRFDETHTVTLTQDASPAAAVPMPAKAEEKSS